MVRRISQRLRTTSPSVATGLMLGPSALARDSTIGDARSQSNSRAVARRRHPRAGQNSCVEPQTEVIRKGKIAKPTEFDKLVTIQESEHQISTSYKVHGQRPPDVTRSTSSDRQASHANRLLHVLRGTADKAHNSSVTLVGTSPGSPNLRHQRRSSCLWTQPNPRACRRSVVADSSARNDCSRRPTRCARVLSRRQWHRAVRRST
jgi:hypothetical protein